MDTTDLVIFGGTGDLSLRKLLPSLYYVFADGNMPKNTRITAAAQDHLEHDVFLQKIHDALHQHLPQGAFDEEIWDKFKDILLFVHCDINDINSWDALEDSLKSHDADDVIYYMAVPPFLFGTICHAIKEKTMDFDHARVVVEKPLGEDLQTSGEINDLISETFAEDHIYRVDHHLGKTAVRNFLPMRFQHPDLDKIWNREHIDHIDITVFETVGVEKRFEYLDRTGVLRDMVQNHLMQFLTLMAMDKPKSFAADDIRDEKAKTAAALRRIDSTTIDEHVIRAQYDAGQINGHDVPGYLEEISGRAPGTGETYVAIKTFVDNDRWQDVPFYLRTGKRMYDRYASISIHFKTDAVKDTLGYDIPSCLTLNIQPEISVTPDFFLSHFFDNNCPLNPENRVNKPFGHDRIIGAYEALFVEVFKEIQTCFVRRDEIEASWRWVDSIRNAWKEVDLPMHLYTAGSHGPENENIQIAPDKKIG